MGLVRSPEIREMIERKRERIECVLDFLREGLRDEERVTLEVIVTKSAVSLDTSLGIEVGVQGKDT